MITYTENKPPIEDLKNSDLVALMLNYGANRITCQVSDADNNFDSLRHFDIKTITELGKDVWENNWFIADDSSTYDAARAVNDDGSLVTYTQWIKSIDAFKK